jgi:hypothetical protein
MDTTLVTTMEHKIKRDIIGLFVILSDIFMIVFVSRSIRIGEMIINNYTSLSIPTYILHDKQDGKKRQPTV